ncbi:MAG: hypothetical protein U1E43_04615 [Rhodospirillales bacterium]
MNSAGSPPKAPGRGTASACTVTDLLPTQAQYFQSQANLLGAQQQMRIAAYQVLAAVGRLTARDLGLQVQLFDPQRNYDKVRNRWWSTGPDLR